MDVLYPEVEVQLVGEDGNAFMIIARVSKALRRAGAPEDVIDAFRQEAMSGDYANVLATAAAWVNVY